MGKKQGILQEIRKAQIRDVRFSTAVRVVTCFLAIFAPFLEFFKSLKNGAKQK